MFAMTLQCEEKGGRPLFEMRLLQKALSKNHPDIINITHEKPNSIGIEEIREQLTSDVDIRPYSSPHKIYIINDAQLLTLPGAECTAEDDRGAAGVRGDSSSDQ